MSVQLIREPSVRLVGRQAIDESALAGFLADNGVSGWETDAEHVGEKLVEVSGRLCYMSFARARPGGNAAYLGHILEAGHGSVLEHCVFNLIIEGVSRSFTHELVRHRAGWGYSQLSQRYVDESDVAFVVPPLISRLAEEHGWLMDHWARFAGLTREMYSELADILAGLLMAEAWRAAGSPEDASLDMESGEVDHARSWAKSRPDRGRDVAIRKAAREAARSVLPNATETKIFVTANARALRAFIDQRAAPEADAEMRRVAVAVLRIMQAEAPAIFADYAVEPGPAGSESAVGKYRKV